jgi:hypothetical protein
VFSAFFSFGSNFYLVAEAQISKPVKRMAVIHIVSLSELRIADTAPKLSYGKQNYRQLRKTLKNAGDLGGRTKSTCV